MKKEYLIEIVLILSLFMGLIVLVNPKENLGYEEKVVTKIIDGDTLIIQGGEKVRMLGIDCDERGKKCYGEAKDWLEEKVLGEKVRVEKGGEDKDIYGRSLRYIFLNGENINLKIVEEGLCVARFETGEENYKKEISKAEEKAINNKIGCKWN
jgi:micrococcal nuclease